MGREDLVLLTQRLVVPLQGFQLLVRLVLNSDERIVGCLYRPGQLVELEVHGLDVAVLGVLDDKN